MLFVIKNLPNNNLTCFLYLRNVDFPSRKYLAASILLASVAKRKQNEKSRNETKRSEKS